MVNHRHHRVQGGCGVSQKGVIQKKGGRDQAVEKGVRQYIAKE
jgi:hypothetical protein